MTPQMIGSAIGAYQPPPAPYGVGPGMPGPGSAPPGSSGGELADVYAMLGLGAAGGRGGGNGGMNAAAIQSIQGAPNNTLGGIQRGIGEVSLANSVAQRYGQGSAQLGSGLGAAGGLLSVYNGVKQGGVMGYGSAAVGGLRAASGIEGLIGNAGMASTLGMAAGYVAAPLALYSAVKNWQSGKTGADTIQGAEAGAAIGSVIPGIGTLIGGLVGGAVGAISSAFGGGSSSQEALTNRSIDKALAGATSEQRAQAIGSMSPSQAFQTVQGYMNAHDNAPGHSEQIEQVFGKNGVNSMFQQMMPAINSAISKDPSLARLTPTELYAQVAAPWLKGKGATINPNTKDVKGNPEGQNLIDAITGVIGSWQSGGLTSQTRLGVGGQTMNIPNYGG